MSFSTSMPRFWALIPAAGSGSRAGGDIPKQYQQVAGAMLVSHTLAAFAATSRIEHTLLAVAPGDEVVASTVRWTAADCGGTTRAATVANGLEALRGLGASESDWVLVHDAARCLITSAQIEALMTACEQDAVGGLLALKLPDTLKQEQQGRAARTLDRDDKWLAQTPQMFRLGALADALRRAAQSGVAVTDEASAIEAMGLNPLLVLGSAQNFKVTYPEDFALAEAVLHSRTSAGRTKS